MGYADSPRGGIQFALKTGLDWAERTEPTVGGKYTFLPDAFEASSGPPSGEPDPKRPKLEDGGRDEPACTLPVEVQTLMRIMFDKSAVERVVAKYECELARPAVRRVGVTGLTPSWVHRRCLSAAAGAALARYDRPGLGRAACDWGLDRGQRGEGGGGGQLKGSGRQRLGSARERKEGIPAAQWGLLHPHSTREW